LQKSNGEIIINHAEKKIIFWEEFKERLGQSEFTTMAFNLISFLISTPDLDWLDLPFTRDKIDSMVKSLPNDKAPGPDGFNNEFIKRCWHFIKEDFYQLCFAF
jgi:hypothetical protein